MALFKQECPYHGLQYITNQMRHDGVVHEVLACGCTIETETPLKFNKGDIVRFDNELYIVVDNDKYGLVSIQNINGYWTVSADDIEYVGPDTISGMFRTRLQKSDLPRSTDWESLGVSVGNSPKKKDPKNKPLSISTADLIKDEVKELQKTEDEYPVTKPLSKKKKIDVDSIEPVQIKKRKGKW